MRKEIDELREALRARDLAASLAEQRHRTRATHLTDRVAELLREVAVLEQHRLAPTPAVTPASANRSAT